MKRALAVIAIVAAGAACSYATRTTRYAPSGVQHAAPLLSGREIFLRDCAWCHGNQGTGTPRAPDLTSDRNGAALTDFMLRTGRMPITDVGERVVRRPPAYPPAVIDEVVAYVASLGGQGPAVPHPDAASGDLGRGEELYQLNCAACHSATGIGGTLSQRNARGGTGASRYGGVVPDLRASSAVEIAEAMRTGPGTMPVFGEKSFDDGEIDSIVRYLEYLRTPSNRGGAELGRVGPVAEGAIAWIVGLTALALLTRWIGTTVHRRG